MQNWKDLFPKKNRYYETENGILYNADCLDILKELPKQSIDLILTDPLTEYLKKESLKFKKRIIREYMKLGIWTLKIYYKMLLNLFLLS